MIPVHTLRILCALSIIGLLGIGITLHHRQYHIETDNQNIEQQNFTALENDTLRGRFVTAWRRQIGGELKPAQSVYNEILHQAPPELARTIQFNLANIYLRQAISGLSDSNSDNDDSTLPLIELAKHIYRKLLEESPDLWPAKHNLEVTILLAPDSEVTDIPEDILPERSPESHGVIEEYRKLP